MRSVSAQALVLRKALRHVSKFLGKFLDRAMHQRGGGDVGADQEFVERALAEIRRRLLAERIVAISLQRLTQRIQDLAERALAGAVAEKAVLVLQLDIETVHVDRRQSGGAVAGDARGRCCIFGHFALAQWSSHDNGPGTHWFHGTRR